MTSSAMRVLLVEDMAGFSSVFAEWLKESNLSVDIAATGIEAMECLQLNGYDLAFVDVHLPDLNGPDLMKIAAASGIVLPRCYALTGDGRDETRRRCLDAGFIDVLVKPLLHSQFVELLEIEKLRAKLFD